MKLIISDIDGTLIKKNDRVPYNAAADAIKRVRHKGMVFSFCSGRSFAEIRGLFPSASECFYICCDGALCMYNDEIFFGRSFSDIGVFDSYKNVLLYGEYITYIKGSSGFVRKYKKQFFSHAVEFESTSEIDSEIYKAVVCGEGTRHDEISGTDIIYRGFDMMEYIPEGAGKCPAAERLCKMLNINEDNCFVFGDGENDIKMLEHFKNSYADIHSKPYIKAAAKNITYNALKTIEEITGKE